MECFLHTVATSSEFPCQIPGTYQCVFIVAVHRLALCCNVATYQASGNFEKIFQLATLLSSWFPRFVLIAVGKLDGLNVGLFHVEQSNIKQWQYRIRPAGGEWSPVVRAVGRCELAQSPVASGVVEVEWSDGSGDWVAAQSMEFAESTCDFALKVDQTYDHPPGMEVVACALVHGQSSVWSLDVPGGVIAVGDVLRVRGESRQFGFGQVLESPGDFQCRGNGFSVVNAGKSQAALRPVDGCEIGSLPAVGGFWAIQHGCLPDDELMQFRKEIESWPV